MLQDSVELGGSVDALLHERPDEIIAAGVLPKVVQEHECQTVVRTSRVKVGPVIELRIGNAQIHLAICGEEAVRPLAEHRVPFVEPDRGSPAGVELDHVAELVGDDPVEVDRPETFTRPVQ